MAARASAVICNTDPVRRDFQARYPARAGEFLTIHNGYDAEAIGRVRASGRPAAAGLCRFVHTGTFYGSRSPIPFLQALAKLVARRPDLGAKLRFRQIGATAYDGQGLADLADRFGVGDLMEITPSIPHEQALRGVFEADVAVAAGQVGRGADLQIPRKFYEYYGLGKPILVTGGTTRAIEELTAGSAPAGLWLVEDLTDGAGALAEAMEEIVDCWERGLLPQTREPELDFTEDRMAAEIESVLRRAASMAPAVGPI